MNLLDRNQYAIWFSDRCNYKCTYCTNNASPTAPKSPLEANTDALIALFQRVEPGVVMLSGGEPFMWKDFPRVLEALPQHYWVFLTNLSFLPPWLDHPNIKLFIPAYHEEFADEERFTAHLLALKRMGKPVHVKIIVKPGQEYAQVPRWERWRDLGVLASFTPLEYTYRFRPDFLRDVITKYRTCSLYNARFFRRDAPPDTLCVAGTDRAFQVNSDGRTVRCSSIFDGTGDEGTGTIWAPSFDRAPRACTAAGSCYCEWHHWGQMAPANDNEAWTGYIETGRWQPPTVEELHRFVLGMSWDPAGRNTDGSAQSLFEPQITALRAPAGT